MSFLYDTNVFNDIIKTLEKTAQQTMDLDTRKLVSKLVTNLDVDFENENTVSSSNDYELTSSDLKTINDFILFLFKNEIKFNNNLIVKQELDATEQDKQNRKLFVVNFDGQEYNTLIDTNSITNYVNYLTQKAQDTSDQVVLSLLNGIRSSLQGVINEEDVKAKELVQKENISDDMAISLVPSQYSDTGTNGSTVITVKDLKDQFNFNSWLEKNNITVPNKDLYSNLGTVMYWLNTKFNELKVKAKNQLDLDKANFAINKITELANTFNVKLQRAFDNETLNNKSNITNTQNIQNKNQQQVVQNQNQYFNKAVNNLPFRPYSITLSKFRTFFDNLRQFDPAYNSLITQALNSFSDAANLTISNLDTFSLNGGAAPLYQKVNGRNAKEKLNNFYIMLEKLQEGLVISKEIIDALYYKEEKPILDNKSLNNEFRLQVGKSPSDNSAFSDNMRLLRNIKSEVQKNISQLKS